MDTLQAVLLFVLLVSGGFHVGVLAIRRYKRSFVARMLKECAMDSPTPRPRVVASSSYQTRSQGIQPLNSGSRRLRSASHPQGLSAESCYRTTGLTAKGDDAA